MITIKNTFFLVLFLLGIIFLNACANVNNNEQLNEETQTKEVLCKLFNPSQKGTENGYHGCEDKNGKHEITDRQTGKLTGVNKRFFECNNGLCGGGVLSEIKCPESATDLDKCWKTEYRLTEGFGDCVTIAEGIYTNGKCDYS